MNPVEEKIHESTEIVEKMDEATEIVAATQIIKEIISEVTEIVEGMIADTTEIVEEKVAANEKLDNLDTDKLDPTERKRAAALRKQREEWIAIGHGEYSTLESEKEFFVIGDRRNGVILHCYRPETKRCEIVDKHLDLLAKKHIESKFCRVDIENAPFLCKRLEIRVIPTIILCKGSQNMDYIVGFDELGGVDDFSTEILEWRIAKGRVINYDGDLSSPPKSGTGSRRPE